MFALSDLILLTSARIVPVSPPKELVNCPEDGTNFVCTSEVYPSVALIFTDVPIEELALIERLERWPEVSELDLVCPGSAIMLAGRAGAT